MNDNVRDCPKSLRDPVVRAARVKMLNDKCVLPLTRFVDTIRKERGLTNEVPYFDPLDGGINARCLFIHEAPGPKAIRISGFISRNNPDQTANNFFLLNEEVSLPRIETVSWNIVPWYIGDSKKIRAATPKDIKAGLPYLDKLIELLPEIKAVVLIGKKAQHVETYLRKRWPDLKFFLSPHPSQKSLNCNKGSREQILDVLGEVVKFLKENT